MADGQDYTQDKAFLSAKPEDQHAYLMSADPGYAKASPDDQKAFRASLGLKEAAPSVPVRKLGESKPLTQEEVNKFVPPTRLEKNVTGEGISLKGTGTAAWEKLKSFIPPDPTQGRSVLDPRFWYNPDEAKIDPAHGGIAEAGREFKAGLERGKGTRYGAFTSPVGEAVASGIGSIFGVSGIEQAENAAHGEGGKIIGQTAVPAAVVASALIPGAEIVKGARERVGAAIHEPATGAMTKNSEALSRGGGAAIGGAAGAGLGFSLGPGGTYAGAGIGATAGGIAGPAIMEKAFPEPASRVAAREEFVRTKTLTEANEAAVKENAQRQRAAKVEQLKLQREAESARREVEDARNQHAEDLMRRQEEQDKLDRQAKRDAREAQAAREKPAEDLMRRQKEQDALDKQAAKSAKEAEDARNQHAQDLMNRQKQQDALDAKHTKALKAVEGARQKELADNERFIQQHAEALNRRGGMAEMTKPARITAPVTAGGGGRSIILPGETIDPEAVKNAGSAAQATAERLQELARFGDRAAAEELVRRRIAVTGAPKPMDYSKAPLPQGNVKPMEKPAIISAKVKPMYKPSEKAATMSEKPKDLGPEFKAGEVGHEIERNKAILRDSRATDEDKAVAQKNLKDLEEQRGVKPMTKPTPKITRYAGGKIEEVERGRYRVTSSGGEDLGEAEDLASAQRKLDARK